VDAALEGEANPFYGFLPVCIPKEVACSFASCVSSLHFFEAAREQNRRRLGDVGTLRVK
jgi:hypothetical protein